MTSTCKKKSLYTDFLSFTKINSKLFTDQTVKSKTIKLSDDNIGGSLDDLEFGDAIIPKARSMKEDLIS